MLYFAPWRAGAVAGVLVALLSGCGQTPAPGAGTPGLPGAAGASGTPQVPSIPTVEPTCIADYPRYDDATHLVARADVIIRGTATASRDYDSYPMTSTETDPAINPQAGVPPEEVAQIPPIPATALTVRVTEVIKGDVEQGEVLEVNQNQCTARPLPTGPGTDYVLVLSAYGPGVPLSQLNDDQAAWQVASGGDLVPVSPGNDLGVDSISDLVAAVPPPCTRGWVADMIPGFSGAADAETALQEWLASDPAGDTGPEEDTPRTGWSYEPSSSEDEVGTVDSGWEVTIRRSTLDQWRVTGVDCR